MFHTTEFDVNRGYGRHCSRSCAALTREAERRGDSDILRPPGEIDFGRLDDLDFKEDE